jgi:rhodanese-related sulfurtransferase
MLPLLLLGCNGSDQTTNTAIMPKPQVATSTFSTGTKSTVTTTAPPPTTTPAKTINQPASTISLITAEDLYENYVKPHYDPETLITDNANYATVDARDMDSWNAAHIPDALSIVPNTDNTPAGAELVRLQLLMIPKDKLIVFYDDNLDLAPALAQQFLDINASKHLGYDPANVKILAKGFVKWMELNYPNKNLSQ